MVYVFSILKYSLKISFTFSISSSLFILSIPVIGNGDIVDVLSAKNMFEYTGCDGIMVARGAQGNPWIFKSILDGKDYIPSKEELYNVMLEHIKYALEYDIKKHATLKLRKHIAWYLKGLEGSTKIKDKINRYYNLIIDLL